MKKIRNIVLCILSSVALSSAFAGGGPSAADVGDADSFGRNAQYMGAASGSIRLTPSCTPAPTPVPPATANDDQCFNLNPAPAVTTFSATDICRIKLPKKSTTDIIYPALNFFIDYELQNTSGSPQPNAIFAFSAELIIESDVLLDPSIIDPNTGLPANGKLVTGFGYSFRDDRSMQSGDRARLKETLVRVGNAGINKANLVASGLSQSVVDDLFKKPMTIRMNVTGTAQLVTLAKITCNMRLFGD